MSSNLKVNHVWTPRPPPWRFLTLPEQPEKWDPESVKSFESEGKIIFFFLCFMAVGRPTEGALLPPTELEGQYTEKQNIYLLT